jgi:hypothetical protein
MNHTTSIAEPQRNELTGSIPEKGEVPTMDHEITIGPELDEPERTFHGTTNFDPCDFESDYCTTEAEIIE